MRPEVRIIDHQIEQINDVDYTNAEANYLLAKYGYIDQQPAKVGNIYSDMTPDEIFRLSDVNQKNSRNNNDRPITYTIDPNNIGYNEKKYSDLGFDGQNIGIEIQIVSDMKI